MPLRASFLFDCIGCREEELKLIESYEASEEKTDASTAYRQAILETGIFDRFTLFEDGYVEVCLYSYEDKELVCVKWSAIHHFFEIHQY